MIEHMMLRGTFAPASYYRLENEINKNQKTIQYIIKIWYNSNVVLSRTIVLCIGEGYEEF